MPTTLVASPTCCVCQHTHTLASHHNLIYACVLILSLHTNRAPVEQRFRQKDCLLQQNNLISSYLQLASESNSAPREANNLNCAPVRPSAEKQQKHRGNEFMLMFWLCCCCCPIAYRVARCIRSATATACTAPLHCTAPV